MDFLTFLGSRDTLGCKTWTPLGARDYVCPVGPYVVKRIEVADLLAAGAVLLQCPSNAYLVRGRADADTIPYRRHRATADGPASLHAESHRLIPIDWDDAPDLQHPGNLEATAIALRAALPSPFATARCLAVATSSACLKPGARLRLWFWVSRPLSDAECKRWLGDYVRDLSVYTPSQPIYCAPPRFEGVADPFAGRARHVWLDGTPEVQAPDAMPDRGSAALPPGSPGFPGFGVQVGMRNSTLTSLAGTMRKRGMAADAIAAALIEHNKTFAEPLDEDEVQAIAESVERYEPDAIAVPSKASRTAGEKAARKAAQRLSEDPALLPVVAADLLPHVRSGALSEGQAVTAMRKGLDAADVATTHTREELSSALVQAVPVEPTVPNWGADFIANDDGVVVSCPENLRILLQQHPDVGLWWNSRAQIDMWDRCPWHPPGPVLPTDDFALRAWVSRQMYWHKCPAEPLAAVAEVARKRPWDPWRAFLDDLKWDGVQRVHRIAHEVLGAPDEAVYATCFSWWLISAVARSLDPGCQVDHVIVLEGPQMLGKTSFLRMLAMHDAFFTRLVSGSDLSSPRTIGKIHGPVIIEMAELAVLRRAEIEAIKAFVDERTDRVQWLYARKPVDVPRSNVFAATTNESEYLHDVTGNRRWWPIPCGDIRLDRLEGVREQIWAEAVALYRAGCKWWPTRDEMIELGLVDLQASRQEQEPLEDKVQDLLATPLAPGRHALTGTSIPSEALGADGRLARARITLVCELAGLSVVQHARSVARVLKNLGWKRLTAGTQTNRFREWRAPDDRGRWEDRKDAKAN